MNEADRSETGNPVANDVDRLSDMANAVVACGIAGTVVGCARIGESEMAGRPGEIFVGLRFTRDANPMLCVNGIVELVDALQLGSVIARADVALDGSGKLFHLPAEGHVVSRHHQAVAIHQGNWVIPKWQESGSQQVHRFCCGDRALLLPLLPATKGDGEFAEQRYDGRFILRPQ